MLAGRGFNSDLNEPQLTPAAPTPYLLAPGVVDIVMPDCRQGLASA